MLWCMELDTSSKNGPLSIYSWYTEPHLSTQSHKGGLHSTGFMLGGCLDVFISDPFRL